MVYRPQESPILKRRPSAFSPGQYCRAIVSLMIATGIDCALSRFVKVTSLAQRNVHRLEVVGTDLTMIRVVSHSRESASLSPSG